MPTVLENRRKWSEHSWEREGHEWSPGGSRAGTDLLWWRSIRPRVHGLVPAATILEIAPGFGRWTSYLLGECDRLIGVDVTERCVEVCRERFAGSPAEFRTNDGESLPMVASASIDLTFSFDSLVHVEAPQIRAYLRELARTLKPGASGFFHHSNLGAYARGAGGIPSCITKRHWRAASMSARVFREACRDAGLVCVSQEVINWIGRGAQADRHRLAGERIPLTDCFSTFIRPPATRDGPTRVYVNRRFVDEWRQLLVLSTLYGRSGDGSEAAPPRADDAASAVRRGGPRRVLR
ncbi:MAG: class I SAM-dependent methyltransferase, partial [Vicinamibacterales bacterium]